MQASSINTVAAETNTQKYFAFLNASTTSAANSTNFSANIKLAADRMRSVLELVYPAKSIYVTYRKTFVTIKIANIFNTSSNSIIASIEPEWESKGYIKKVTAQGTIYRIKK